MTAANHVYWVFLSPLWQENVSPAVIARMYEDEFKKDMLSLKVRLDIEFKTGRRCKFLKMKLCKENENYMSTWGEKK